MPSNGRPLEEEEEEREIYEELVIFLKLQSAITCTD
jgi:hypothetical protein